MIHTFIQKHDIRPGYAIKAQIKNGFPVFDHWLIYLGFMPFHDKNGLRDQHIFAINMSPQEQFIGEDEVLQLLKKYYPVEIQACYQGYDCNPNQVAQNAINKILWEPEKYHLLRNNCQDFVKKVTTGESGSYQREKIWFWGKIIGGAFLFGASLFGLNQIINNSNRKRR